MKILLSQIDGHWTAEVDGRVHILKAPTSVGITKVVDGIHRAYPYAKLSLDKRISDNPFLQRSLQFGETFRCEPLWPDIEKMLANPSVKICNRCQTQAWYDAHVHGHRCSKCRAIESQVDAGRFFKVIARHDKWRR